HDLTGDRTPAAPRLRSLGEPAGGAARLGPAVRGGRRRPGALRALSHLPPPLPRRLSRRRLRRRPRQRPALRRAPPPRRVCDRLRGAARLPARQGAPLRRRRGALPPRLLAVRDPPLARRRPVAAAPAGLPARLRRAGRVRPRGETVRPV